MRNHCRPIGWAVAALVALSCGAASAEVPRTSVPEELPAAASPPAKLAEDPAVALPLELMSLPETPTPAWGQTPTAELAHANLVHVPRVRREDPRSAQLLPGQRDRAHVSLPAQRSSERERALVLRLKLPF